MQKEQGHSFMENHGLDVLGITVAGSLITAPSWYEVALNHLPAPTTVYVILGCLYLTAQLLDKLGLLPRFGNRRNTEGPK